MLKLSCPKVITNIVINQQKPILSAHFYQQANRIRPRVYPKSPPSCSEKVLLKQFYKTLLEETNALVVAKFFMFIVQKSVLLTDNLL